MTTPTNRSIILPSWSRTWPSERSERLRRLLEVYPVESRKLERLEAEEARFGEEAFWRYVYMDPQGEEGRCAMDWCNAGVLLSREAEGIWVDYGLDGAVETHTTMWPLWRMADSNGRQRVADFIAGFRAATGHYPRGNAVKAFALEVLHIDVDRRYY